MRGIFPCRYCFNARVCPPPSDEEIFRGEDPFTDDNDLSYCSIGSSRENSSIMFRSGGGKPHMLVFSKWNDKAKSWDDVAFYMPKFCPECGRRLDEYEK